MDAVWIWQEEEGLLCLCIRARCWDDAWTQAPVRNDPRWSKAKARGGEVNDGLTHFESHSPYKVQVAFCSNAEL